MPPRRNLSLKSLYPDLNLNLAGFPDALNHPNVTFLFALREYGSFFSSNVTTTMRRGNVFDLEKLRASLILLHRSWIDVVSDLQAAFPAAMLKIWQYEQFQKLEAHVFSEFSQGFEVTPSAPVFETLSGRRGTGCIGQGRPGEQSEGNTPDHPEIRPERSQFPLKTRPSASGQMTKRHIWPFDTGWTGRKSAPDIPVSRWRTTKDVSPRRLTPQHTPCSFRDLFHDPCGNRLDIRVLERRLCRLQPHGDGQGFLAFPQ